MAEDKKANFTDLEAFTTDALKARLSELRRYL